MKRILLKRCHSTTTMRHFESLVLNLITLSLSLILKFKSEFSLVEKTLEINGSTLMGMRAVFSHDGFYFRWDITRASVFLFPRSYPFVNRGYQSGADRYSIRPIFGRQNAIPYQWKTSTIHWTCMPNKIRNFFGPLKMSSSRPSKSDVVSLA